MIVDSEQVDEEDETSEIEEEDSEKRSLRSSLTAVGDRWNTGGQGTAIEARRRS